MAKLEASGKLRLDYIEAYCTCKDFEYISSKSNYDGLGDMEEDAAIIMTNDLVLTLVKEHTKRSNHRVTVLKHLHLFFDCVN